MTTDISNNGRAVAGATARPLTARTCGGRFLALEGTNGSGKSTLAAHVADLDYAGATRILADGDPRRGLVWVSRKQPAVTDTNSAMVMARLAEVLWGDVADPAALPDSFWAATQAAWFTAFSSAVLAPLLDAGFDVLVDGWIGRISTQLLAQGNHSSAELAVLFAHVRRPDVTVLVDVDPAVTWQRHAEVKPGDLGIHAGADITQARAAFTDYQQRTRTGLCLAAAEHSWPILHVGATETAEQSAQRLAALLVPLTSADSDGSAGAGRAPAGIGLDAAISLLTGLPRGEHYRWPHIDSEFDAVVTGQARRSLSDRDARGVIGEFEAAFAGFVGAQYAVAFASGTAAIHAMSRAAGLRPGDEIIAPAYTFAATASPFAFDGVTVRFADADPATGNVTAETIAAQITPRTRAVIVTHLWGIPARMDEIAALAHDKNLWLFEDCSHAHFASWQGRRVGLWGDMAAFSCNQKAITSGEGGVLVTGNHELRDKAILFGHYGKRSATEIDAAKPYARFAMTGMGLKERITTLGAAIGVHQLARAADIEDRRRAILDRFAQALADNPALQPIRVDLAEGSHGLYVLGLRYQSEHARFSREEFVSRCHRAGATEVDIPGSTGDISGHPLFARSDPFGEWQDTETSARHLMPGVRAFAGAFVKLPLWGYPGDGPFVDSYLRVVADVASKACR
ncbi:aminotransferase class V-fold PLP-dependent enzyme [Nocardia yunnanensis]|uniref:Aminotransferase class V-fold PLP-dependent enzyme n=1 Tax=Nocardia yunnanensis TaxID=2382165 RepID=A0A386ZCQ4_9NOCA|nr:aminotransferase class I/II-fold pyridoxal phosphate-dependent enzyme [Nocardia yunnanensis]AYF75286.1 aminotransferase class V-fold PLP-dependent enzyme [Nocardia yunnanensis]